MKTQFSGVTSQTLPALSLTLINGWELRKRWRTECWCYFAIVYLRNLSYFWFIWQTNNFPPNQHFQAINLLLLRMKLSQNSLPIPIFSIVLFLDLWSCWQLTLSSGECSFILLSVSCIPQIYKSCLFASYFTTQNTLLVD